MVQRNQQTIDRLALIFEAALGESPRHAKKLAVEWQNYRVRAQGFCQQLAESTLSESIVRAEKITVQDNAILSHFHNSTNAGVVLLTIHMGDYLHSAIKILRLTHPSKVIFLKRKSWSQEEENAFGKAAQLGYKEETVRHGPSAASSIVKSLRNEAIAL